MGRGTKLNVNDLQIGQKLTNTKRENSIGTIKAITGTSLSIEWENGSRDTWSSTANLAVFNESVHSTPVNLSAAKVTNIKSTNKVSKNDAKVTNNADAKVTVDDDAKVSNNYYNY